MQPSLNVGTYGPLEFFLDHQRSPRNHPHGHTGPIAMWRGKAVR